MYCRSAALFKMPAIKQVPFSLAKIDDHSRSGGVHVSDITRDIGLEMGYIPPEYIGAEMIPEIINIGLAWEDFVFPNFHPEVCYHPGEASLDGVSGTCDGVSYDDRGLLVHEAKTTRKSMKKEADLAGQWLWLAQTMSYCKMWGTLRARYHILWLNGDYQRGKDSSNPSYRLYDLEFSQREINDNWTQLVNRGRSRHGLK